MKKSHNIGRNVSSVSIRYARSCNVVSDANENGKVRKQVINIDALRTISRIVLAIQQRIEAGSDEQTNAESASAGNVSSSSKTPGPNSGKDTN